MAKEQPPRVLVVEDNQVNQAVALAILARLGYRADVAGDGQQAVELVARGRCGLVLMDCQLPIVDGYQATAEIRRREGSARRTPIIALTAAVLEDRQRCLAAGMDDHIAKPVLLDRGPEMGACGPTSASPAAGRTRPTSTQTEQAERASGTTQFDA